MLIVTLICIWLFALGNRRAGGISLAPPPEAPYISAEACRTAGTACPRHVRREEGTAVRLYGAEDVFNSREFSGKYEAKGEVTQSVSAAIAWENGTQISRRHGYMRKKSLRRRYAVNGRIAALGVDRFRHERAADFRAYGWKLILGDPSQRKKNRPAAVKASTVRCSLDNNLGYVTWEYRTRAGRRAIRSRPDASAFAVRTSGCAP